MSDVKATNLPRTTTLDVTDQRPQEHAVKDIYIAAYLAAMGYKLDYARSNGYQSEFYFKDVPSAVLLAYYNGEKGNVSAKKLFDEFQNMRRISRQVRATYPLPEEKIIHADGEVEDGEFAG